LVCAFQLFDVVVRSDTVSRIAAAVSRNVRQFLWTLVLLFTIVWIYSLIGFYFLQDAFVSTNDNITQLCPDSFSCFLVNFNYGLRAGGGIADNIQRASYDADARWYYFGRTIYDLSFFILCIILLLNLIFGMIIDSFGELRDEKNKNDDDRKNTCFVCGMDRSELERHVSFDDHSIIEHNKWNYLAYLIYLKEKMNYAPTELSDLESYVWERYEKKDYEWVPIGRSLTLERIFEQEEKQKKSEIEIIKEEMSKKLEGLSDENKYIGDDIKQMKDMLVRSLFGRRGSTNPNSSIGGPTRKF